MKRMNSPKSFGGHENDAHRRRHFEHLASVGQAAGFGVDSEYNNVVRLLVRRKEIPARRIDCEVARRLAPCWNMFNQLESSRCRIDCEHRDVIRTTIRSIEKLTRSIGYDLGGIVLVLEVFG